MLLTRDSDINKIQSQFSKRLQSSCEGWGGDADQTSHGVRETMCLSQMTHGFNLGRKGDSSRGPWLPGPAPSFPAPAFPSRKLFQSRAGIWRTIKEGISQLPRELCQDLKCPVGALFASRINSSRRGEYLFLHRTGYFVKALDRESLFAEQSRHPG